MVVHVFGLALNVQAAGQLPGAGEALLHGGGHHTPHTHEIVPDLGSFVHLNIFYQIYIPVLAELQDLSKGVLHINLLALHLLLPALYDNVAAANAMHPDAAQLLPAPEGNEVHGVGVLYILGLSLREDHLCRHGGKGLPYGAVSAVAPARLGQRAIENRLKFICLRMLPTEDHRRPGGAHGVGAGRSCTNFINITDGFHGIHPFLDFQANYIIAAEKGQPRSSTESQTKSCGPPAGRSFTIIFYNVYSSFT